LAGGRHARLDVRRRRPDRDRHGPTPCDDRQIAIVTRADACDDRAAVKLGGDIAAELRSPVAEVWERVGHAPRRVVIVTSTFGCAVVPSTSRVAGFLPPAASWSIAS
jgi:hypothetical protein